MKLLTYKIPNSEIHQIGVLKLDIIYNMNTHFGEYTDDGKAYLENFKDKINDLISSNIKEYGRCFSSQKTITTLLDAYAFRQHVCTSRANRGLDMAPEFDQFPVFYFSNHNHCSSRQRRDRAHARSF